MRVVLRLIKELDAEGTIKTPLNGCLGTLARVIFYGPNSLSGDKYKSLQNWNKIQILINWFTNPGCINNVCQRFQAKICSRGPIDLFQRCFKTRIMSQINWTTQEYIVLLLYLLSFGSLFKCLGQSPQQNSGLFSNVLGKLTFA